MSKGATIRISAKTEAIIKENGKFGETHDQVLLRLLTGGRVADSDARPAERHDRVDQAVDKVLRTRNREGLKQSEYGLPILMVLFRATNYALKAKDVLSKVKVQLPLREVDLEYLPSAESTRWEKNANFAKYELVKKGLICSPKEVGYGIWKLTPKGVEAAHAANKL